MFLEPFILKTVTIETFSWQKFKRYGQQVTRGLLGVGENNLLRTKDNKRAGFMKTDDGVAFNFWRLSIVRKQEIEEQGSEDSGWCWI